MPKEPTKDDIELLNELGVDTTPETCGSHSPLEQRVIAGFEEIQKFFQEHGRIPCHGEDRDIFERLYAVRLDQLKKSLECLAILKDIDTQGILTAQVTNPLQNFSPDTSDKELLESLGVESEPTSDISKLQYVRPRIEIQAAEEVAQRVPCRDFSIYKPLFERIQKELQEGFRKTLKFQDNADIKKGDFFILDGQKLYIATLGDKFINDYGRPDRRLRVIYDNGTEIDILLRSLQRALNKDKASRRISDPNMGPLFSDKESAEDQSVGYIYVLRSNSKLPFIAENRNVIHKIGVTSGSVEKRITCAEKDPTYLLSSVEIIETYKLANLDPTRLEGLIHKFFEKARLDVQLKDRFGIPVEAREWFLVPLPAIEDAVQRIIDGTIDQYYYEPSGGAVLSNKGNKS